MGVGQGDRQAEGPIPVAVRIVMDEALGTEGLLAIEVELRLQTTTPAAAGVAWG